MKGINVGIESGARELDIVGKFGKNGIVTYTEPLIERSQYSTLAFNPDNGIEMNINAQFGGTPQLIHDGEDAVGWTGASVSGSRVTFDSTNRPRTGSQSVYMNRPVVGEVWEFDKGSTFDPTAYTALTIWVNVDNNWAGGDSTECYAYDSVSGLPVGNAILLEDYFTPSNFDVWQELIIPITDFGVGVNTFDTIRMEVLSNQGTRPRWYIDDMYWQESGGTVAYEVTAPKGNIFSISKVQLTFIDAYDPTLADSNMPNLSYDKILGEAKLANGINLIRQQKGKVEFSATVTCLGDFTRGGGDIGDTYSDGTNTVLRGDVNFSTEVHLDSRSDDKIIIEINDDLTGFISLTAVARGYLIDNRTNFQTNGNGTGTPTANSM